MMLCNIYPRLYGTKCGDEREREREREREKEGRRQSIGRSLLYIFEKAHFREKTDAPKKR